MAGESEKMCPSCGAPQKEGASFCTKCGAPLASPDAGAAGASSPEAEPSAAAQAPQAAVPPPASPAAPQGVPGAPMPATVPAAPPRRSKAPLLIGSIGGILVVAGIVVLVLWLTLWSGGEAGSGDPISLAEKYMDSLEKGDLDAYMACFEEDFFLNEIRNNPIAKNLSDEDIKQFAREAFNSIDVRFEDVGFEVKSQQGDRATVVTTGGTANVSVMGMKEAIDLYEYPIEFNMVKKNGTWYLTDNPMGADIEDLNLEDLEQFIPEDLDLEDMDLEDMDLEELLPDDLDLEDLEDFDMEDLDQLLEDIEELLEDMPAEESSI